jgi:hypothetical protein
MSSTFPGDSGGRDPCQTLATPQTSSFHVAQWLAKALPTREDAPLRSIWRSCVAANQQALALFTGCGIVDGFSRPVGSKPQPHAAA